MTSPTIHPLDLPGQTMSFQAGETIAQEGDPSEGWYVLLTGKVGVFKGELLLAEFDTPGTVVGELGFFLDLPRTASIRAFEPSTVLFVESDLDDLIANHPGIVKEILISLAARLSRTTEAWWSLAKKAT